MLKKAIKQPLENVVGPKKIHVFPKNKNKFPDKPKSPTAQFQQISLKTGQKQSRKQSSSRN